MKKYRLLLAVLFLGTSLQAQISAGFEFADYDTTKIINGNDGKTKGYYGNADNNGSGMFFYAPIEWDTAFGGYWKSGWALSKVIDTTEEPSDYLKHLYAARPGTGKNGVFDQAWAVGQNGSKLYFIDPATGKHMLDQQISVNGFYYTNTTYAYNSMLYGDFVGKKFGGTTGNDPDFFTLTVYAHSTVNATKNYRVDTFEFPLADFRFTDNSQDYILKTWKFADLNPLIKTAVLDSLEFKLNSSDVGQWGMNTPAFFAVDAFDIQFVESVGKINPAIKSKVYPNPAKEMLQVQCAAKPTGILVTDVQGKLQYVSVSPLEYTQEDGYAFTADIQSLSPGIYQISLRTDLGIVSKTFIKQ